MLVPPASAAFVVSPSDSVNFPVMARGLYIGGIGNVVVKCGRDDSTVITFTAVPAGTILPVNAWRVNLTSTTATNIVGLV